MVDILKPRRIGIALDFDGTLVDSNPKIYRRVAETWRRKYNHKLYWLRGENEH